MVLNKTFDDAIIKDVSYFILCYIESKNDCALNKVLEELPQEVVNHDAIVSCLRIKKTIDNEKYFEFFKLYKLLDITYQDFIKHTMERMRLKLITSVNKTFVMKFLTWSND